MDADEIARVLSEHILRHSFTTIEGFRPATCSCGLSLSVGPFANWLGEELAHRAHLAAVLAPHFEQARQEGAREALRRFADSRGVNVGDEDDDYWRGYRQAQRECFHDANDLAERAATPGSGTAGGGTDV